MTKRTIITLLAVLLLAVGTASITIAQDATPVVTPVCDLSCQFTRFIIQELIRILTEILAGL